VRTCPLLLLLLPVLEVVCSITALGAITVTASAVTAAVVQQQPIHLRCFRGIHVPLLMWLLLLLLKLLVLLPFLLLHGFISILPVHRHWYLLLNSIQVLRRASSGSGSGSSTTNARPYPGAERLHAFCSFAICRDISRPTF
jgi:hypothetical protein